MSVPAANISASTGATVDAPSIDDTVVRDCVETALGQLVKQVGPKLP